MPRVLMLGPSIDAQGGMATVERNIIEAVKRNEGSVDFISTYEEAGKLRKLSVAVAAYARYLTKLMGCDLVHIHVASRGSFERKRVFMRAAFRYGCPVVAHVHGGEFGVWYEKECGELKRAQIREASGAARRSSSSPKNGATISLRTTSATPKSSSSCTTRSRYRRSRSTYARVKTSYF